MPQLCSARNPTSAALQIHPRDFRGITSNEHKNEKRIKKNKNKNSILKN
jgi:hypothetical protein